MRVTPNLVYKTATEGMNRHNEQLLRVHEALSSGKKINRLSDDPVNMRTIMGYKDLIASLEQYHRNIDFVDEYLSHAEIALQQSTDIMIRLKEIAISNASGTISTESRLAASIETQIEFDALLAIANTQIGDRNLFSGYLYSTKAFDAVGTYQGDSNETALKVAAGNTMAYGITGDKLFKGAGGGVDIMQIITDLKAALAADDTTGIQASIDAIDSGLNQVINTRADVGARINRMSGQKHQLTGQTIQTRILLSGLEDADITELSISLVTQQASLEALQMATAKFAGLSIFNFIR